MSDIDTLERELGRELDRAEAEVLLRIEGWLREALRGLPWRGGPDAVRQWQPATRSSLRRVLASHVLKVFALGRAHAKRLLRFERRLADYTLPEFNFDAGADARFLPLEAMRALEARQLVLAGVFESDVVSEVKKALLAHLAGVPRKETEEQIARVLQSARDRASLIVTTETTYAYNRGRLVAFREARVDYVRFSAVMDARTSAICRSRHGKVMRLDDPDLPANTPPLHGRCRSVLSPLYGEYQTRYITKEALDWRGVEPLPKKWRAAGQVEPALTPPPQPATIEQRVDVALARAAHEVRLALADAAPLRIRAVPGGFLAVEGAHGVGLLRTASVPDDLREAFLASRGLYEQTVALRSIVQELRRQGVADREYRDVLWAARRHLDAELNEKVLNRVRRTVVPEWLDLTRVPAPWPPDGPEARGVRRVVEWLNANLEDAAAVSEKVREIRPTLERSQYHPQTKTIEWRTESSAALVHEFGHHLHAHRPTLAAAIRQWFLRRIGDELLSEIENAPGEFGWRDRFVRHYVGRWYGGHSGGRADFEQRNYADAWFGTEVLATGMEYLYVIPGELLIWDPEHFWLSLCGIKGYL